MRADDGAARRFVVLVAREKLVPVLGRRRRARAMGVLSSRHRGSTSHYFHARSVDQFDAVLHFDETPAVQPIDYAPN